MGLLDKIKGWFASDDTLLMMNGARSVASSKAMLQMPETLDCEHILLALQQYGREAGYSLLDGVERHKGNVLMSSIKTQAVNLHEEILKYYVKKEQSPDEKMLNLLTVVNIFYLAMGSAILAKVKRSNLIAQGVFKKLLHRSGPEYFYREVAAMAGNTYGDEDVEALHQHVQRAAYLLLTECDKLPEGHLKVMECVKAMFMYGLCVTLQEKQQK